MATTFTRVSGFNNILRFDFIKATEIDPAERLFVQNATYDLVTLRDATNCPSIGRGGIIREGSIFEKVFDVKIPGMAIFKVNFWLFGKRMDPKGWRRTHELREPRIDMGRDS